LAKIPDAAVHCMSIALIDALILLRHLACATISQWSFPSTVAKCATVCGL
jgi:hypothetical protein